MYRRCRLSRWSKQEVFLEGFWESYALIVKLNSGHKHKLCSDISGLCQVQRQRHTNIYTERGSEAKRERKREASLYKSKFKDYITWQCSTNARIFTQICLCMTSLTLTRVLSNFPHPSRNSSTAQYSPFSRGFSKFPHFFSRESGSWRCICSHHLTLRQWLRQAFCPSYIYLFCTDPHYSDSSLWFSCLTVNSQKLGTFWFD